MILLIASRKDRASVSMSSKLLEIYDFKAVNDDIYEYKNFRLQIIDRLHIYEDMKNIDGDIDSVIFLSKHSSKADIKSLTVHPIGNFRKAELGGYDNEIVCSNPMKMSASLRYIRNNYNGTDFEVTFEATHHGPYLQKPSFFIEIGTTENEWGRGDIQKIMVDSIINGEPMKYNSYVGIGGGHYSPKLSNYFFENNINIGHIIPKYVHEFIQKDEIENAVKKTPDCRGFLMDSHGSKGRMKQMIREISESYGLEIINI